MTITVSRCLSEFVANITSKAWAQDKHDRIDDDLTFDSPEHYEANFWSPEDHGTAHVSVVAPSGDAVAVTTTVNQVRKYFVFASNIFHFKYHQYFGSEIMSPRTGIVLNDQMDDFSFPHTTNGFGLPPSAHNFARPGKRPQSSMCPTIVTQRAGQGDQQVRPGLASAN